MPLRPLLFLAALGAILLAATFWRGHSPHEAVIQPHLVSLMPADIPSTAQDIVLHQSNATLRLHRHDTTWHLSASNTTVSTATVEALLRTLAHLRGELRPGPPEAFGFGADALRITVTDTHGQSYLLEIGRLDFRIGFVRRPNETQVFAVGGELYGALGGGRAIDPLFWGKPAPEQP